MKLRLRSFWVGRLWVSIALWVGLALQPLASSAQTSSGFWLRERLRVVKVNAGIDLTIERLVFRDGVILITSLGPEDVEFRRRQATPGAVLQLHAALQRDRIGAEAGQCSIGSTPFDFFERTLTSFTGRPKGHSFRTGDRFTDSCGIGTTRLIDAISAFIDTAPFESGLQDVLVPNASTSSGPSGFLLRERFRFTRLDAGIDTTVEQVVFRDGLIVVMIQEPNRSIFQRRFATAEAIQALQTTLRLNRIGQQQGNCTAGTTPFDFFERTLTSFSGGPRGYTIKTGDRFSETCGTELTAIIDAISIFITTSPAEPGLQDVRVPN